MADDVPPWITFEHSGLVGRWGNPSSHRWGCGCMWMLAPVWSVIICVGLVEDGVSAAWCFMAVLQLLLWPLAIGMLATLTDRFELRLSADELTFTRWRYGRRHTQTVALAGSTVTGDVYEGGKGWTHTHLKVQPAEGPPLTVQLKPGDDLRDREQVKGYLRWLEGTVREVAESAVPPSETDPEARAKLTELLRRRAGLVLGPEGG